MPNPVGRPSSYEARFAEQAKALTLMGATEADMANFFEVSIQTLYNWRKDHQEFLEALKMGKDAADSQVVRSLYERATGYRWTEQQAFKVKIGPHEERIEVVDVEREVPPDTTAAIFWLKNRRRTEWRDVHQIEGQAGAMFAGIKIVIGNVDGEQPAIEVSSAAPSSTEPTPPVGKLNGRTKP